ncbi:MAG: M48 family metallopeptidase [Patescibacteria group bacterium]|nr:M48 family metallopeptidase [Patescibacteria group bacterium]
MTTYDFINSNKRKTVLLMVVFLAFVMLVGWAIDQYYGLNGAAVVIAGGYSLVSALVSYYAGDKVALASSGARVITQADDPRLYRMVENLCITIGMPMPKVHVIDDPAINAFATGRDPEHASIAVTTGAMQKLENEELEGVLAHEISHIRNFDIRLMTVVVVLVGTIALLANMAMRASFFGGRRNDRENNGGGILQIIGLILIILSPIIAELIKLAVSRRRELLADSSAALMTRFPEGLARALNKIDQDNRPLARASTATAHLFFTSPFSAKSFANLFSTHPPIAQRIMALRNMANLHE